MHTQGGHTGHKINTHLDINLINIDAQMPLYLTFGH